MVAHFQCWQKTWAYDSLQFQRVIGSRITLIPGADDPFYLEAQDDDAYQAMKARIARDWQYLWATPGATFYVETEFDIEPRLDGPLTTSEGRVLVYGLEYGAPGKGVLNISTPYWIAAHGSPFPLWAQRRRDMVVHQRSRSIVDSDTYRESDAKDGETALFLGELPPEVRNRMYRTLLTSSCGAL
ncbi:hypothetical protein LTS18_007528 [Coniosporium uncinatum]|uniref:Uncharacterized protein n=1 Tax=Coniosporium uncinatum TaxID=93489 RepID=A0ACC3DX67_9PEZI|nr:hypothetical protein LTS18_007528 [Coniosporium uncinatum]